MTTRGWRARTAGAALAATVLFVAAGATAWAGGMMMDPQTGDANNDGSVNSLDALQVMFYASDLLPMPPYTDELHVRADIDCDGVINAIDATLILQHEAGLYDIRP